MEKNNSKKPERKNSKAPRRRNFSAKTGKVVYIGNLRYTMEEKDLFKMFVEFGSVGDVNLQRKPGTEESKGIAFIEMYKAEEADKAIEALNGTVVGGRTIKVSEAVDNRQEEQKTRTQKNFATKAAKKAEEIEQVIIKKKYKRRTGLDELFANTGRK